MQSSPLGWMKRMLGLWLGLWLGAGCGQPSGAPEEQASLASALGSVQSRSRIAAGNGHSVALRPDGSVWTAGDNYLGQLGDGTKTNRIAPVQVQGLSGVVAVAAGSIHSLAVRSDGTAWAWGSNSDGQLGNGGLTMYGTTPTHSLLY